MNKKIVLFDFDGVIADSFDGALKIFNKKIPNLDAEGYRQLFMGNVYRTSPIVLDDSDPHEWDFFKEYAVMAETIPMFAGIDQALRILAENYTLVVISSSLATIIDSFLMRHACREHVTSILGVEVERDKTKKIQMVFDAHAVSAGDCVFVTDTVGDMHEAHKAGVGALGVSWGFHAPETLIQGNPTRIVHHPNELHTAVVEYFAA